MLVDDHALVREGLESVIAKCDDLVVVGTVGIGPEALALRNDQEVHVVLLDMRMDGLELRLWAMGPPTLAHFYLPVLRNGLITCR